MKDKVSNLNKFKLKDHHHGMNKKLKEKIVESFTTVLPITVIVLILSVLVIPLEIGTFVLFIVGAILLILGMGFFQLGAETSMTPIGDGLGKELSKSKNIPLIIIVSFLMGFIITIAEPDLQVLANQVSSIPNNVLISTIAVGVGLLLAVATLRILFKVNLSLLLMGLYAILFLVAPFAPANFLAVAFDSGGVTTGPITVPFIMAIGVGFAALRSDKNAADDSFGLVALCSVGPILMVLILGIFYNPSEAAYAQVESIQVATTQDVFFTFLVSLPDYMHEMFLALIPVLGVFIIFQIITKRYKRQQKARISIGLIYTFIGLSLFLTGVNIGFLPVAYLLGEYIALSDYSWLLVPFGMLIGFFIVKAEPAVQVLNRQVEEITNGAVTSSAMGHCLSIGVAISIGLSMLRILTGIPIMYILIPSYLIAFVLTFFVPKMFIGIAFDSGGVASGPMTSTFLLPLAIGACEGLGGNIMTDAFGVVAFVAMTPLIMVQIMGIISIIKRKEENEEIAEVMLIDDNEIVEYEE